MRLMPQIASDILACPVENKLDDKEDFNFEKLDRKPTDDSTSKHIPLVPARSQSGRLLNSPSRLGISKLQALIEQK